MSLGLATRGYLCPPSSGGGPSQFGKGPKIIAAKELKPSIKKAQPKLPPCPPCSTEDDD